MRLRSCFVITFMTLGLAGIVYQEAVPNFANGDYLVRIIGSTKGEKGKKPNEGEARKALVTLIEKNLENELKRFGYDSDATKEIAKQLRSNDAVKKIKEDPLLDKPGENFGHGRFGDWWFTCSSGLFGTTYERNGVRTIVLGRFNFNEGGDWTATIVELQGVPKTKGGKKNLAAEWPTGGAILGGTPWQYVHPSLTRKAQGRAEAPGGATTCP